MNLFRKSSSTVIGIDGERSFTVVLEAEIAKLRDAAKKVVEE